MKPIKLRARLSFLVLAFSALPACNRMTEEKLPQAYVAPISVNVRSQLNQKNSTVAVLHHGESVGVVDVRRRYVKVRTNAGVEGWVDSGDLLGPDEMKRIEEERKRTAGLPSQGVATAYEALNIHLNPNRKSPAFAQIPEGGAVEVLARKLVPKIADAPRPSVVFERPKPPVRKPRKEKQAKLSLKPPMPPRPKPPENWQRIWGGSSETGDDEETPLPVRPNPQESRAKTSALGKPAKPPIMEDWTLIRTKNKQVGWVLARNLMMSIPDDVAQYAAGKHITAYFDLGTVNDERDGQKHNWLWTTAGAGEPFDFDSWRVFLWNRRHHRYETSYRERDLEGHFPVHVDPLVGSSNSGSGGRTFQIVTKDDDGRFRRRAYLFDGMRVHLTATEDYQPGSDTAAQPLSAENLQAQSAREGWLKRKWSSWKQQLSSKH